MEIEPHHQASDELVGQTRLPTNSSGKVHLTDWAVGVVDSSAQAQDCARALEEEGISAGDILIVPGETALQQLRGLEQAEQEEHLLLRVRDEVLDALKQAHPVRDDLEAEARAGLTFLGIHVPDTNQIDGFRNTLVEHQVHHMYLFEPTMITRLL